MSAEKGNNSFTYFFNNWFENVSSYDFADKLQRIVRII